MDEQTIFIAALEIADPGERATYVATACGADEALRSRVHDLLAAHERSGEFLEVPAFDQMRDDADLATQSAISETAQSVIALLEPSEEADSLGRLGSYEILEVLGEGGFGVVLRAFDVRLLRMVAIKMMSPQLATTSPPRKRFLREARSAAQIRHNNVVAVYDVAEQPLPYLVMEYVPGVTVQQEIDRLGPLPLSEIVRIGREVALGLAAAHELGLTHRDVKPGNILLETGPNPRVKLTDFGLARTADDASLTQSGVVSGTPLYMSPEQAKGGYIDQRADLFSLGSVLYVMSTGRAPFRAANTFAVLKRVVEDTPRPIGEVIPELPIWLDRLIAKLHAKAPNDRLQTAREVADILTLRATELTVVPPIPPPISSSGIHPHITLSARRGFDSYSRPQNGIARSVALVASVGLVLALGLYVTDALGLIGVRQALSLYSPSQEAESPTKEPESSVAEPTKPAPQVPMVAAPVDTKVALPVKEGVPVAPVVSRQPLLRTGDWTIHGDEVVQTTKLMSALLFFGSRDWQEFDYSCELWHGTEDVGISMLVQANDSRNYVYAEYGGYKNSYSDLQSFENSIFNRLGIVRQTIPTDRWTPVLVKVRGHEIEVFVDGQLTIHGKRKPQDDTSGYIGLRTFNGGARFRKIKVVDPAGKLLWEGFPDLPVAPAP
ncbi:MAG TPA: protein kinase [Pirellulaceae bacterium]|nr:protein kinase [Pirellulaceae bacterium]